MNRDSSGLGEADVRQYVGNASFVNGRQYFYTGQVLQLYEEQESNELWIMATVQGTRRKPYITAVSLRRKNKAGRLWISQSECDCPVAQRCKHIAATLLAYLQHDSYAEVQQSGQQQPEWQQMLEPLLAAPDRPTTAMYTPVALAFEINTVPVYNYNHYGYSRPAKPQDTKYFLGIRPVVPTVKGVFSVVSKLTWRHVINGSSPAVTIRPEEMSWLQTIWAQYSLNADRMFFAPASPVLELDSFASARIWQLLQEGRDLGVPYVDAAGHTDAIFLHQEYAKAELELRESTSDGAMTAQPVVQFSGKTLPAKQAGFLGQPAFAAYWWEPTTSLKASVVHLARFESPPHPPLLEAVRNSAKIVIPAQDKQAFADTTYPRLAKQLPVKTAKVKVTKLPDITPPELVMDVTYKPPHRLLCKVSWQYKTAGTSQRVPLFAPHSGQSGNNKDGKDASIRDPAAERKTLDQVAVVLAGRPAWWQTADTASSGGTGLASTPIPAPAPSQFAPPVLRDSLELRDMAAAAFVQQDAPALAAIPHVTLNLPPDLPDYRESTESVQVAVSLDPSQDQAGGDWFDLGISIKLGEQEVPFGHLFEALAQNETELLLQDGTYFSLERPEFDQLRKLITEARGLHDKPGEGLKISRFQASLWDELQSLGVVTRQAADWEAAVRGLLDIGSIPKVTPPKTLQATLRPYQKQGYNWLHFLWTHRLGGILADDMGLGKTLQTIALLLRVKQQTPAKERKPVLIIAPTSVTANWMSELEHFAPSLKLEYVQQQYRTAEAFSKHVKGADVVVSSYGLFRLDLEAYQSIPWNMLVLDEAQFVKNHQSKGYQAARKLDAPFKLVLSGTPLENNLMELWALLSIAAPGLFPSPKRFADFYQKPIEKQGDQETLKQLRRRVRPLMLRRTKEQVAAELPPKIEQVLECELLPEHKKIYETYLQRERQRILGLLGDIDKNRFMIFKSLTTLRQLSLDARLVDAKKYAHVPSTKLEALLEQLDSVLSEGHRALLFSQFTSYLALVRQALDERGIKYLYLDGSTKNRRELIDEFKQSGASLFLISLKAGGFGLNLTEADYCFLLDPWWNPAAEQQAVDRTHRIGQTKQVVVYRMVAKGTIEEKVMALKARKSKLFKSVLDDDQLFSASITAEDIRGLFEGE